MSDLVSMPATHRWQRAFRRLAMTRAGAWLAARTLHHVDRLVARLSGGRATAAGVLGGLPIVMLTTTGRRSGRPRSVPVIAVPDGGRALLVGSNWGGAGDPAWVHNLRANPAAGIVHNGTALAVVARELAGAERAAAWERAVALYPGYAAYQRRRPDRRIPVLELTPTTGRPDHPTP